AVGDEPFDVTGHTNTHDRVTRVDTNAREADMLIVRAFAGGKHITYHSFSSSDPGTAAMERVTFIPALGGSCCVGASLHPKGVRTAIDDPKEARGYTPLWDLNLGEWSPAAVAAGMNTAQTDANA